MAHARLSASSAHRWTLCPGSVRLSDGIPNKSSAHAVAGTLAHEIAARCLTDERASPQMCTGRKAVIDGHTVECDLEMVDGVQFYLDTLDADVKKGDQTFVEVDLTPALKTIDPELGGTADFVRWRPSTKQLRVVDLKYGAGKVVEPTENKQLMLYALGALLTLDKPAKDVTVTIVQPRIEHEDGRVRDWTFPAVDLINFAADVAESARRTRDSNAPLVPGEVQCGWCPARHTCPELEKRQHALVAQEFSQVVPYDPVKLAQTLDAIPLVEARIKAIREFAYEEAERGNPPPGYKLVQKRAVRKWKDELSAAATLLKAGVAKGDVYEQPEMRSPAQIEKLVGKKVFAPIEAAHVESVSSGHTLVPVSDKRPEAHKALAQEFSVVSEGK